MAMDGSLAQPPAIIQQVKTTRYSIARCFGRMFFDGHTYSYMGAPRCHHRMNMTKEFVKSIH